MWTCTPLHRGCTCLPLLLYQPVHTSCVTLFLLCLTPLLVLFSFSVFTVAFHPLRLFRSSGFLNCLYGSGLFSCLFLLASTSLSIQAANSLSDSWVGLTIICVYEPLGSSLLSPPRDMCWKFFCSGGILL